MATFRTHTQGGSWAGGGTEVPNCNSLQQASINTALGIVQSLLNDWPLECLTSVRDSLQDRINCSLVVDCQNCSDLDGQTDSRGSPNVMICDDVLNSTQSRTNAVLFHEMVHSVGGTELDAEALENHFFGRAGATFPSAGDFDSFHDDGGEFVIWDQATGELFERCEEGGSWDSSPTVSRGSRLTPIFPDPGTSSGGSWI